ncbi:MAG: sugar phosphate isomerase/epimerase, partial [Actinobacteria bacterium]|nr:sugar phosphate isomerase/epimerase [Actinomycetota bacterium]
PAGIGVPTIAWDEWRLERALEQAAAYAGLVEIYSDGMHSLLSAGNRSAAQHSGLEFTVHGPYDGLEIGSRKERHRRAAMETHRRHLEAAAEIGATRYVVHPDFAAKVYRSAAAPGGRCDREWGHDERVVAALQASFVELEELQRTTGVRVVIENMPAPGRSHLHGRGDLACGRPGRVDDPALDLGELGFVLDAGHAAICGTLQGFLADPPPGFAHVHLHDNKGSEETGDPHLALGQGVVDACAVLEAARRARATVILELGDEVRLRQSIAYLELEGMLDDATPGAR